MTLKILVTGGSGLIGSSIKELINKDNIFVFLSSKETDLRDSIACEKLFSDGNFDIVIHLASVVGGLYFNTNNNYSILVDNIKINTNILECCKKYNIKRLINILSTCIFGNDLKYPLTSNQMYDKPPDSSNEGYSTSKRLLATGSDLLTKCSDIKIVNLIPTNLIGKNDNFPVVTGTPTISDLVQVFELEHEQFSVYPNPCKEKLSIFSPLNWNGKIELLDNYGKQIYLKIENNEVNLTEIQNGIYFLSFTNANGYRTIQKIEVIH